MEKRNPAGKTIAVSDGAKRENYLLKRILEECGRGGFNVLPESRVPAAGGAAVLLAPDAAGRPGSSRFQVRVARYSPEEKPDPGVSGNTVTYSTQWNGADFTARNIRPTESGLVSFEIVGVGIIGRVRLKTRSQGEVEPALAAAAAAIAAGVPFAEALDALNRLDLTVPGAVQ